MPEPVSIVIGIFSFGYAALGSVARSGSAVSPAARVVSQAASALVNSAERSHVLFGGKAAALSRLWAMANECAEDGWDADNSCPLDPISVRNTDAFLRALPDHVKLPEIAPEPDGSVSLDWVASRHRLVSLSIGASNRLAYAWLDGTDKGHGVARFDGNHVPSRVLEAIEAIMAHGNASLRAT